MKELMPAMKRFESLPRVDKGKTVSLAWFPDRKNLTLIGDVLLYLRLVLVIAHIVIEMRYIAFRQHFKDFTIFSRTEIESVDPRFQRRRLNEWQQKGYLKKIIKGFYIFADTALNEETIFEAANRIYAPSYISLEMALSHYGLIPESVYGITSVTTRPTRTFVTPIGAFAYRTLKPRLYFGYDIVEYAPSKHYLMASPEKALLDFLYLNPSIAKAEDFESLRLTRDSLLRHVKEDILFDYLSRFEQRSLSERVTSFWRFVKNA